MFNEIEEAVVAVLRHDSRGLPSDSGQLWHVPATNIGRHAPDLTKNLNLVLPAVRFVVSEFDVIEDEFGGIGELEGVEEGLREARTLKFDLLYHLEAWATDLDTVNAIVQKAIDILFREREQIQIQEGDYRLLRMRPVAGRSLPDEAKGNTTIHRKQVDYRIESELLIGLIQTPIQEVIIEKVEWQVSEE